MLKLAPVGVLLGRAGAVVLVLVASFCLVQAGSAVGVAPALAETRTQAPAPVLSNPLRVTPTDRAEWEVFPNPKFVIPLGRPALNLPILMYHYIRTLPAITDALSFDLSVTPAKFQEQMDWLAANGYHPVNFDDVRAYFGGRQPLPAKPIVITLDDGYLDLYTTAYPILRAHHFKAVAYIVSGFLTNPAYASAAQVQAMDADGIQIGSHTITHVNLQSGSNASSYRQITESGASLERLLGHRVLDFAYPSGKFDSRIVALVQHAGYDTAVTTNESVRHSPGNRWTWTRTRVRGGESLAQFIVQLGSPEPSVVINGDYGPLASYGPPPLGRSLPLLLPIAVEPKPQPALGAAPGP